MPMGQVYEPCPWAMPRGLAHGPFGSVTSCVRGEGVADGGSGGRRGLDGLMSGYEWDGGWVVMGRDRRDGMGALGW